MPDRLDCLFPDWNHAASRIQLTLPDGFEGIGMKFSLLNKNDPAKIVFRQYNQWAVYRGNYT